MESASPGSDLSSTSPTLYTPVILPPDQGLPPNQGLPNELEEQSRREIDLLNLQIAAELATIGFLTGIINHYEEIYNLLKNERDILDIEFTDNWKEHQTDIDHLVLLGRLMPRSPFIGSPRGLSCRDRQPQGYDGLPPWGAAPGNPSNLSYQPTESLMDQYDELRLKIWNFDQHVMEPMSEAYAEHERRIRDIEGSISIERSKVAFAQSYIEQFEYRKNLLLSGHSRGDFGI